MNVYPERFRIAVHQNFSQELWARFAYFERWNSYMIIAPNEKNFINYQKSYDTQSEKVRITYRDDGFINLTWVQVEQLTKDARTDFDEVIAAITEKVPTYSLEQLQTMFTESSTLEDKLFALYAACVNAPWAFDQTYFDAVNQWSKHEEPKIRAAVTIGIGYIGLTEYETILERLKVNADGDVRERATQTLEGFAAALVQR
jgi:hypothetical protein